MPNEIRAAPKLANCYICGIVERWKYTYQCSIVDKNPFAHMGFFQISAHGIVCCDFLIEGHDNHFHMWPEAYHGPF